MPHLAGLLCSFIGLLDILSALTPEWHRRVQRVGELLPGALTGAAKAGTVVIGLLLLLLSHALLRRKRRAWQAVTGLLGVSVLVHLARPLRVGEAVVAGAMLAALVAFRGEFYAVGDPRTRWRALGVGVLLGGGSVGIGLAYLELNEQALIQRYGLGDRVLEVVLAGIGIEGPVRFTSPAREQAFSILAVALCLSTVLAVAYLFVRPAEPAPSMSRDDERALRALLARWGERDSLGYFALRRDKSVLWSPTRKSAIAYRVVSGVMLASGDPIGDPEAWPGAIHAFLDEAARHAWVPAVMGCGELGAEVWCREGELTALELGDEAVLDVAGFTLEGRAMRNVRQMVARVARQGYTVGVRRVAAIPPAELRLLVAQMESWRDTRTERGFSMALGRIGDGADPDCLVATATRDGELHAFLHFVPWGAAGLSLDLMRRDAGSQPGLNDFMIVETVRAVRALGVERISLNFAVFRSALERGERIGAGPVLRAWRAVLVFLSRWFQIESLYRFNDKFHPVWVPRFCVFPGVRDATRVAIAALEAEAFIAWPRLGRLPGGPRRFVPGPPWPRRPRLGGPHRGRA